MKTEQDPKDIPRTARLGPASLARLRGIARKAAARARAEGQWTGKPQAEVTPGPMPKIDVTLRFVPMDDEAAMKLGRISDARRSCGPAERPQFGAEEVEILRKAEPRLLKWIAESENNAVLFVANPLKALVAAGVKLNEEQLLRLRLLRQRNLAKVGSQPPSSINTIKVITE